jgi:hypothetical protein
MRSVCLSESDLPCKHLPRSRKQSITPGDSGSERIGQDRAPRAKKRADLSIEPGGIALLLPD